MAKIEIRVSCTCAKDIFHERGKARNERIKIRMDDKDIRIDTCDVQEIHGVRLHLIQGHRHAWKELGAMMKRMQPDTNGQRYSQRTPWTRRAVKQKKRRNEYGWRQ